MGVPVNGAWILFEMGSITDFYTLGRFPIPIW